MSRFFSKLRKRLTPGSRRQPSSRLFRPNVEALDSRIVPASVTYHGGAILSHVDVRTVFYGQGWNTSDSWGITRYYLDKFQADITKSPYMAMLGEYGVGRGSFGGYDNVTDSSTPAGSASVTESQIQNMLRSEIFTGRLPWETGNKLYFVYLAPGQKLDAWDVANSDGAHHGSYLLLPGFFNTPVYYAVVPYSSNFQTMTWISSHELAEAVTDPDVRLSDPTGPNTGFDWTYGAWYNLSGGGAEIGDIVNGQTASFAANGTTYTVQKEWSNYFGRGIIANGNQAGWLDVPPTTPYSYRFGGWDTYNNNGRTTTYSWSVGWDGRYYLDFVTAAGDFAGTFTIAS
jgi:hypothetical protein